MASSRLFVYYRLAEADVAAAAASVRRAQQALCERHPGLTAELLQRPDPSDDGRRTIMETYIAAGGTGIGAGLQSIIASELGAALLPWLIDSDRHVEVFEDLTARSSR